MLCISSFLASSPLIPVLGGLWQKKTTLRPLLAPIRWHPFLLVTKSSPPSGPGGPRKRETYRMFLCKGEAVSAMATPGASAITHMAAAVGWVPHSLLPGFDPDQTWLWAPYGTNLLYPPTSVPTGLYWALFWGCQGLLLLILCLCSALA